MNKKELKGQETKKRIVECAYRLFRERGFNAVSVDEIILAANSSKGGFYTHFKSKEELIFCMVPMADEAYLEFERAAAGSGSAVAKISSLVQYVFDGMEKRIGLDFMSAIYAYQLKNPTSESFLTDSDRVYYRVFEKLIVEGMERGEIRRDIDSRHTVELFTTAIRGAIYDWCLHKGSAPLSSYGRELPDILLEQIKTAKTSCHTTAEEKEIKP